MRTVFSHIVQKRLSQENENVATEALAFILQSKGEAAKRGLLKLLRGILPELPNLWFRTQQTEGSSRPDMWGLDEHACAHVFIENKFWAGLTDNQPVSYLRKLSERPYPTLLLVVVPSARERYVWKELTDRLREENIATEALHCTSGAESIVKITPDGPVMALTNWTTLLSFLEAETTEDLPSRNDIAQLRALCDEAESGAFFPFSHEAISDQRIPSLILQLTGLVDDVSARAFEKNVLFKGNLKESKARERIGRYVNILPEQQCGGWLGIHFGLWKEHGQSPFWIVFPSSSWGRSIEVRARLEPWAADKNVFVVSLPDDSFAVAISIPGGEETKSIVVERVVNQIAEIGKALEPLPPRMAKTPPDIQEE